MFLSSLAELPFFDQFNKPKDKIIQELGNNPLKIEEENKDNNDNSQIDRNEKKGNNPQLVVIGGNREDSEKSQGKCKC